MTRIVVVVESTWGGGDRYGFRLTLPNGAREQIMAFKWRRAQSIEALNLLEHVYGYRRSDIRFDIR